MHEMQNRSQVHRCTVERNNPDAKDLGYVDVEEKIRLIISYIDGSELSAPVGMKRVGCRVTYRQNLLSCRFLDS